MSEGIDARFTLRHPGFTLDAAFEAPGRGITAVFGPSGSGKTTLLRCVAGLERSAQGRFSINGECWQDSDRGHRLPTHRRRLGYVFQDAGLLPHLSVRGNLEYVLRRTPREEQRFTLEQVTGWLGISALSGRRVGQLSGGERSRVAVARALLGSPRLLLMDEPLAGLDAPARQQILPYLERLHRELSLPVLYVSHALDEVARLADHLVCLTAGRVSASGPAAELLTRLDLPTAHGDDACALIEATVSGIDAEYGLAALEFGGGELLVANRDLSPGEHLRVRVLARDVSLSLERPRQTSILNIIPARISEIEQDRPGQALIKLDAGGVALLARITQKSVQALTLSPGQALYAQVKSVTLHR